MRIRLDTNNPYLYVPIPSYSEAQSSYLSEAAKAKISRESQRALFRFPLVRDAEQIPLEIFTEMLSYGSKFLYRILFEGGPISTTPLLDVVNPTCDYSDNFKRETKANPYRKRLIPRELLAERIHKTLDPTEFASKFVNGIYPREVVFKPNASSGGDGVLKLKRTDNEIVIKLHNSSDIKLESNFSILEYVKEHSDEIILSGENSPTLELRVNLTDSNNAITILSKIVRIALTSVFLPEREDDESFKYTDIQSGLVEAKKDLLTIGNQMIEGRYYVTLTNGNFYMSKGHRMDGLEVNSYMKIGRDDEYVNTGTIGSQYPNMHQLLIDKLNLDCTNEEFNEYISHLLHSQALKFIHNLLLDDSDEFSDKAEFCNFIFDIAWDKNEMMKVPKPGSGAILTIPKPIIMEASFGFQMKSAA